MIGMTIFIFICFLIIQWGIVLGCLHTGDYITKKEFLLKMIPGYFIIALIKVCFELFTDFMLLK